MADLKRLLVTGSRTWADKQMMRDALRMAYVALAWGEGVRRDVVLVHGGARGADSMAGELWSFGNLRVEIHEAQWRAHGVYNPHAGIGRNQKMVELGADLCLAFIHNGSRGATDCAARAERAGIPVRYYRQGGAV